MRGNRLISVARSADGGPPEAFAIHGSNTIGARLMPALVEAYAASVGANALTLAGSQPEEVELKLQTKTGATLATSWRPVRTARERRYRP